MTMQWTRIAMLGLVASLLAGCSGEPGSVQRTGAENTALEHDKVRLERELGDCRREVQRLQKEAQASATSRAAEEKAARTDRETIEEMRQAIDASSKEREELVRTRDEISKRLLEAEQLVAQRALEISRAAEAVRGLQKRIDELSQEIEKLRSQAPAATSPSQ